MSKKQLVSVQTRAKDDWDFNPIRKSHGMNLLMILMTQLGYSFVINTPKIHKTPTSLM